MQTHLFHRTYNECKRGTEKGILLGSTNSVCLQVGTVLKLASSSLNMTNTSTCARDYMSVHNDNPELTVNQNNHSTVSISGQRNYLYSPYYLLRQPEKGPE